MGHYSKISQTRRLINDRNLSLTILETVEFKIKVLADSVPGEGPLSGLYTAVFTLYLHLKERAREPSGVSLKGTNPIHEGSTPMT